MNQSALSEVITAGIKGLHIESLREIADFVVLVRLRQFHDGGHLQSLMTAEMDKLRRPNERLPAPGNGKTAAEKQGQEAPIACLWKDKDIVLEKIRREFGGSLQGSTMPKGPVTLPPEFKGLLDSYPAGFGGAKGMFVMAPDFDEPLEDFKEYMY